MTKAALDAARAHWGLKGSEITLFAARENQIYQVQTDHGLAALRLHRPGYRSLDEIRSEMEWMAMLAGEGITLPEPIPALDGSLVLDAGGYVIDLLTWLDGDTLTDTKPTPALYEQLGVLIARMQRAALAWDMPQGFTRPTWDLVGEHPSWGRFWENPDLSPKDMSHLSRLRDTAGGMLARPELQDRCLIHADLIGDNVLVHNGALSPIDFDDGGFGHPLFDLATVTNRSLRFDPSGACRAAAIKGYREISPTNLDALPLFEALRAASYIGWIADRMDLPNSDQRLAVFLSEVKMRIHALDEKCKL